ncbi:hypothetical protein BBD41_06930 [Paenibacillus ihbetae]|uniref:Uncharacterized protein n=1 Tax=Paenibacillus ihbetae TaxID=1870820 RepID=A0A1B2DX89_9BACL|nr:hypothetical protein BBD41_06930 [Paenibacillus ihbetae]OOC58254.1 hypothetical protein BBD40_21160 [Paenibacillus ihbetae]
MAGMLLFFGKRHLVDRITQHVTGCNVSGMIWYNGRRYVTIELLFVSRLAKARLFDAKKLDFLGGN